MIQPSEIEYQDILGQGNGGMVHKAIYKTSSLPLAIKTINILDKDKRH